LNLWKILRKKCQYASNSILPLSNLIVYGLTSVQDIIKLLQSITEPPLVESLEELISTVFDSIKSIYDSASSIDREIEFFGGLIDDERCGDQTSTNEIQNLWNRLRDRAIIRAEDATYLILKDRKRYSFFQEINNFCISFVTTVHNVNALRDRQAREAQIKAKRDKSEIAAKQAFEEMLKIQQKIEAETIPATPLVTTTTEEKEIEQTIESIKRVTSKRKKINSEITEIRTVNRIITPPLLEDSSLRNTKRANRIKKAPM